MCDKVTQSHTKSPEYGWVCVIAITQYLFSNILNFSYKIVFFFKFGEKF